MDKIKIKKRIEELTLLWAATPTTSNLKDIYMESIYIDEIVRLQELLEYVL